MPKPFDAALKELVTTFPADWLDRLGLPIVPNGDLGIGAPAVG